MIECRKLTKRYRGRCAVDAVDLTLAGGINALLGANGAGKSTMLRLITGLERPDAGSVSVDGLTMGPPLRQRIGVLPDQLGLFESLTVLENLDCVGPIYGLTAAETRDRALGLLALLDLLPGQRTVASQCSYGMRKKTALAMALLHNPAVLVLDEPFEGVDPASSRKVAAMLKGAAARGATVVLTSHILPLVERLATRTVIMAAGRIAWDSDAQADGRPLEEVYFEVAGLPLEETLPWLGR
jgi:ABC-2 type transport system ATP-binding protein